MFLTNSKTCILTISGSTNIFLTKLLPALMPYILLTELIINLNIIDNLSFGFSKIICKLFRVPKCAASTIIISYLLGYPNAAKHIKNLYEAHKIDNTTCKKLVAFTNNASPAYIIGTIGIAMFNNIYIGIILLVSHMFASIIIGISYNSNKIIIQQNNLISNSFNKISFSFDIILKSLINSVKTLSIIWGYTVIFSLLPSLVLSKITLPNHVYGLILGMFEISNGINMLASDTKNFILSISLISFVLSFSSLMVIMQIYSFVYKINIKLGYIIKYKLIHGLLSSVITYIIVRLFIGPEMLPVFANADGRLVSKPILSIVYIIIASITAILLVLCQKKKR